MPTIELGVSRFAETDGDGVFNTKTQNGKPCKHHYTIKGTGGCSCEQIIAALQLGAGHTKYGCSISVMDTWVAIASGAP